MDLRRAFTLSLYGLTGLAGLILGQSEEGWIPYVSLPLVVFGHLITERRTPGIPARGLTDAVATLLGFTAFGFAAAEFFSENLEGRLLSGTHLVVYLTWIVLLQPKTVRRYWLLLALGVLQLAVASVLVSGRSTAWFGAATVVYVFGAVWTLSLFTLYRSAAQATAGTQMPGEATSQAIGSVHWEGGHPWHSAAFVSGVAWTGATGLIISTLFFLLIPRVWLPGSPSLASDDLMPGPLRSRFAAEVKLGDLGTILERMDPVLTVRLYGPNDSPLSPQAYAERLGLPEPLFRGAVLSTYRERTWKLEPRLIQKSARLFPVTNRRMIHQELRMEDVGNSALLCLGIPSGLVDEENRPRGTYQWTTQLIYRRPDLPEYGPVTYHVLSEFPETSRNGEVPVTEFERRRSKELAIFDPFLEVPGHLMRTREFAQGIVQSVENQQGRVLTAREKVQALEAYLRDSGKYSYTLVQTVQDRTIDPVEDFLFNRQQGHCEYFASALVLMVRSVGIPARFISGYKGGVLDQNSLTLNIQQRHAHAWCEAWVDDRTWLTLDATPAEERLASVESVLTRQSTWEWMRTHFTGLWSENVVNISLETQEKSIYGPLRSAAEAVLKEARQLAASPVESWRTWTRTLQSPQRWKSISGLAMLALMTGLIVFVSRRWRRIRQASRKSAVADADSLRIAFYERFLSLMHSIGLQPTTSQTPREFAVAAANQLTFGGTPIASDANPQDLSELYYRVRFGRMPLSAIEIERAENILTLLESVVSPPRIPSVTRNRGHNPQPNMVRNTLE